MTNLIERSRIERTGQRYPNNWQNRVQVSIDNVEVNDFLGPYANQTEFKLVLSVWCTFLANKAQYEDARKNAEGLLLRTLYSNTLEKISYVRRAIFNQDEKQALNYLSQIEDEIIGR